MNPSNPIGALHGENTGPTIQPDPRNLTIEVNIQHQIDRIGFLRSVGESWQEPVYHLRDLIVGLEDAEFWDGVPAIVDPESLSVSQRESYSMRGWNGVPCRVLVETNPDGSTIETPDPTPSELSAMFRIILAQLARRGMTWRRKISDKVPMVIVDD